MHLKLAHPGFRGGDSDSAVLEIGGGIAIGQEQRSAVLVCPRSLARPCASGRGKRTPGAFQPTLMRREPPDGGSSDEDFVELTARPRSLLPAGLRLDTR